MKLIRIIRPDDLESAELAERVRNAPGGEISELYLAADAGRQAAFVVLDWWPSDDSPILYELYVPSELRRRGIGTKVLRDVEALVKRRGRSSLRVTPKPIDKTGTLESLEQW